jgi:acyl-CoA dehydrogenase
MDTMIQEAMERLITEAGEDRAALWSAIEEGAFSRAWHPEDQGGFDLPMEDGFGLVRLMARRAVSAPLAETLFGGWLLMAAGLEPQGGPLSVAAGGVLKAGRLTGSYRRVSFADGGRLVCLTDDGFVVVVGVRSEVAVKSVGLDPVFDIALDGVEPIAAAPAPQWLDQRSFAAFGATIRSAQICGAFETVLEMTVAFVQEREQFGRTLSKFQAIQVHLATMASEVAAASAATEVAIARTRRDGPADFRSAAVAKARASEAVGIVAALAHQCHGAIGYAQEFKLGAYTRRLWQWREDFGNEAAWSVQIARLFTADTRPTIEKVMI